MGYTVVTGFNQESKNIIKNALGNTKVNNIPYGRKCDREAANQILEHHITLIHWGKEYDNIYLPRLDKINMLPCKVKIIGTSIMTAEEGSYLLYFNIQADENFHELAENIYSATGMPVSPFLHITIDVDKDRSKIEMLKEQIDQKMQFPTRLTINSLDVYHIWKPVYLAKQIIE